MPVGIQDASVLGGCLRLRCPKDVFQRTCGALRCAVPYCGSETVFRCDCSVRCCVFMMFSLSNVSQRHAHACDMVRLCTHSIPWHASLGPAIFISL